jgi:hypothetical protein
MAIVGGPWCLGSVGGGTLCGLPGLCEPFLPMPQWSVPGKPIATWWGLPSQKKKAAAPGQPSPRRHMCSSRTTQRGTNDLPRRTRPIYHAPGAPAGSAEETSVSGAEITAFLRGAHQLTTVCRFPGLIDPDTQDDFFTRWCLLSNPGRVR